MIIRKNILSYYSHCIETHPGVVVEVLEAHISVAFDFCLDEEFIEFWLADIVF